MSERHPGDTFDMSGDYRGAHVYIKSIVEGGPARRIPLQRPPRTEHFTDREKELARLLADLQPGRVVTLCGAGGIGKTALSAEAVWTLAPENEPPERFPDGIIFHNFYREPQAALALEAVARAYGEEPRPTPRDAALRALAGKQVLLILDGAEDADDLGAVLDVRGGCGVLVTSRARADAVAQRQDLEPLEADDAVDLLRTWGGDQTADDTAAARICELAGYLPLAVRLAGRYLDQTGETAGEYLAWLEETPLEALDHGEWRMESVDVLLERSLAQVSEAACRVLGVVGLLALAPFDRESIAAALDLPCGQLHKPLGELVGYGLLSRSGERYEVSHALVHTYARERVEPQAAVAERLAVYYATLAQAESAEGPDGYRRLDAERAHIMSAMRVCTEKQRWKAVRSLVWSVGSERGYLATHGHWAEWVRASEIGIKAARVSASLYDEGAFLIHLSLAYGQLGQYERAIKSAEDAISIARKANNNQMKGAALNSQGLAFYSLGEFQQAIESYEEALAIHQEIRAASPEQSAIWMASRRAESVCFGNLGNIHDSLGDYRRAIDFHKRALSLRRRLGDRQGEAEALGNLAISHKNLGRYKQALKFAKQALNIARGIGDRHNEAIQLSNLGAVYAVTNRYQQALEFYEQALFINQELEARRDEGRCLGNLGVVSFSMGEYRQAADLLRRALAVSREVGDRRNEGNWLLNLGSVRATLGETEDAIDYYERALAIARDIADRRNEGSCLTNLGNAYLDLGQVERAREYLQQSLAVLEEIESPTADLVRDSLAELENGEKR